MCSQRAGGSLSSCFLALWEPCGGMIVWARGRHVLSVYRGSVLVCEKHGCQKAGVSTCWGVTLMPWRHFSLPALWVPLCVPETYSFYLLDCKKLFSLSERLKSWRPLFGTHPFLTFSSKMPVVRDSACPQRLRQAEIFQGLSHPSHTPKAHLFNSFQ